MKRMLLVLGLAGLLSMPSVVFGEATWYGSFRGGLESSGDSTHMFSNGSRWGVKGSNEVSEGLSANYRYEEALDLATASLSTGNRLSYVGLSGGFGTISVGRIWSASWNSVGAILDNSYVYGTSKTSYRVGPAVSYSNSVGAASVQLDLVMDKGNSAKSGVDQYEFGLSMDLGAATLAFAHRKKYMAAVTTTTETFVPGMAGSPTTVVVTDGTPNTPTGVSVTDGTPNTPTVVEVTTPGKATTPTMVTVVDGTGTPNTPTVVTVTDAVAAVPAVTAQTEDVDPAERLTLINTATMMPVSTTAPAAGAPSPNFVAPLAEASADDCEGVGIWVVADVTANIDANGCYLASQVEVSENRLKSAKDGAGEDAEDVDPLEPTGVNANAHVNSANCLSTAGGRTAGVWEANSSMCYPAGTVFSYVTREAREAVPAVEGSPIMVETTTEGEAGKPTEVDVTEGEVGTPTVVETTTEGEAGKPTIVTVTDGIGGTPTTVEVTPGTAGTPSMFVTTSTTTPAYDQTLNAFAVKVAAGSHSASVGLVKTSTSTDVETSTTIANAGGPLSDGLSYHLQLRDEEGSNNPWLIGLAKSLGGGSSLIFEHAKDADDEAHTALYLQVDF